MVTLESNKRFNFKTIGATIGLEHTNVLITGVDFNYKLAIKLCPELHTINAELYQYLNADPIDLRNKSFVSMEIDGEDVIMCLDWIIPSTLVNIDSVAMAKYIITNITNQEALLINEIITKSGYVPTMILE